MAATTYKETFGDPHIVVGVAGIIGAGKTTLTRAISESLGWSRVDEPVAGNPYLTDFYQDKKKYGFAMQMFLLHHRFAQHQGMIWSARDVIQDRTIYEDVIFAKMLHESGDISDRDFDTYRAAFTNMTNFLHRPDVIVYLDVTPETAMERVNKRARASESGGIPVEYLRALRDGYEDWIATGIDGRIPVLRVDWNGDYSDACVHEVTEHILAITRRAKIPFPV